MVWAITLSKFTPWPARPSRHLHRDVKPPHNARSPSSWPAKRFALWGRSLNDRCMLRRAKLAFTAKVGSLRVKWRLAYLNEEGELGLAGARPAQEPVKIKEIIFARWTSQRKLDKGGYTPGGDFYRSWPSESSMGFCGRTSSRGSRGSSRWAS